MGIPFSPKHVGEVESGPLPAPSLQQQFEAAADRLAVLSTLPGVVVYQRLVTPDDQIRYTYISENALDLFGVSAAEIISDPNALFSCHSPEYGARFRERLLAASKTLTTWDVEASIIARDGRKKYTHAIARPERKSDGSVLWTGVILDETRTRTAFIDNLTQGVLLYDADDRLILRNSQFVEMFPSLRDVAVPGARYQDILRSKLAGSPPSSFQDPELSDTKLSAEFRRRIEKHEEPNSMVEQQLDDDRWILVNENRTSDGTVAVYTDISDLKRRDREIVHLAYHDALTGLPNRTLFHQRIVEALAQARGRSTTVVVMCLDLDGFKTVNDSLGHPAGDALLKHVAARMRASLRETDTIARLGGDEFGIIMPDLDQPDHATTLAWRLLEAANQPFDFNGHQLITTISIGIVTSATDVCDPDRLLKDADLALYRAKADGRATFRFFEADMDARAQERRLLEMDLRHAVAKEQLELHYQAQVDLYTDRVVGFEALVRWHRPGKGMVAPLDFIPLAEETGVINRLGEWVLRRACTDAAKWPNPIRVAVNVSPAQFKNRELARIVAGILAETGLPPDRLEIEVTESLLLRDTEANLNTLQELKDIGIRISMDDFGTGYSSLSNLSSFAFDKIKIDRSFVRQLGDRPDAAAIVRAVLGLGHSLGIVTCAEGVETLEELGYLRGEGCTEVQGYYYSKPKPLGELTEILKTGVTGRLGRPPVDVIEPANGQGLLQPAVDAGTQ